MNSKTGAYVPPLWFWGVCLVLAFVAYAPALNNDFIADDFNWVYEGGLTWSHPANIFSLVIANFFRPVVHVWFALCRRAFDLHPTPYYVAAIAVHGLNGGVLAWAIGSLLRDRRAGLIAGALFVVHFTHFDAIYWLSAISDLLGTMGTTVAVAAAVSSLRDRNWHGAAAFALTPLVLLCKESMVMVVPLLAVTVLFFARTRDDMRRALRWWIPAFAVWVAYLLLQRNFQASSPHVTTGYWGLGWHPPRMLVNAVANFVVPNRYIVPSSALVVAAGVALGLVGLIYASTRLRPGQGRILLFFLAWIFLTFFPCSFFHNYDRIPSRYSYLPSVAFAAIVGWLAAAIPFRRMNRTRRMLTLGGVGILGILNIAYIWRIDAVRYQRHSTVSREFVSTVKRDAADITTDTTIVTTGTPLPFLDHHAITAVRLYLGYFPKAMISTEPSTPDPARPDGPVVWYRWDDTAQRFTREPVP